MTEQPVVTAGGNGREKPMGRPAGGKPVVDCEVSSGPQRRVFSAEYKRRILEEAAKRSSSGEIGALLRREGLYSSHLSTWRRQQQRGELGVRKRGQPAAPAAVKEVARLRRENARLQVRLEQAETIIAVQKKLCTLLGLPCASSEPVDNK